MKKTKSIYDIRYSIFRLFITWKVLIVAFLFLGIGILPLQMNFLGGGINNYLKSPTLWSWANFDGEHYLGIAKYGYQPLTYFFFPMYPLLIRFFERFFTGEASYLFSGLFVSHISFLIGLIGFVKLIRLDYKENIVKLSLLFLLTFPTSFYFGGVFTESLFFALVVWSFYFARRGNYLLAGFLGGMCAATRITGLAIFPALFMEYFFVNRKNIEGGRHLSFTYSKVIGLLLIPAGLLFYMNYLDKVTGDPFAFFHNLSRVFGEQRSDYLVSLPQVFYRYIFKILPNVNYNYFPIVFTTYLELISALLFLWLTIISFWKLRLSYAVYLASAYLLPTFSGSFSSIPRYVLICFPAFLLLSILTSKTKGYFKVLIYSASTVLLAISTLLFTRGYWLS